MSTYSRPSEQVRFGPFELNLSTRELRTNGTKQTLAPQPFQVLQLLIENRGRLVTREALVSHLWPADTFVDYEQGLKKAVNRLREALNDSAEQPSFIETLPRQGYRFIATLEFDPPDRSRSVEAALVPPGHSKADGSLTASRRFPRLPALALWISAIVICVAGALLWRTRVWRHTPPVSADPRIIQLTANSSENPVTSSAISPDGKYLAFSDSTMKMHVKLLATGETQTIAEPESLKGDPVSWSIAGWFPDGTRFIANARSRSTMAWLPSRFRFASNFSSNGSAGSLAGAGTSIWVVSLLGTTVRKIRDDAEAFSVSPDGMSIAFGTDVGQLGDREIWLMDTSGQHARVLFHAPEDTAIGGLNWSRDGQRVIYFELGASFGQLVSRDLRAGHPISLLQYPGWMSLTDFVWLPEGRLIYTREGNLWSLGIDESGKAMDKPRQLTHWPGTWIGETSVTSDGKRIAFQRSVQQTTVHMADVTSNGASISPATHLTLNEYVNAAETWTPDSSSLVYRSWSNGHLRLFRRALDSDTEEPLVMGAENVGGSAVSPDGSWLFYADCGPQVPAFCEGVIPIMAIPIHGGTPHVVLKGDSYGRVRCAVAPSNLCVIAERSDESQPLVFTAFDALKGRGAELARFPTEPAAQYSWALVPDGTRIAILKNWDSVIHVISLNGETPQQIAVRGWNHLAGIYWSADGKGWFLQSKTHAGVVLLHVDSAGGAQSLWELKGDSAAYAVPSPDGRHLAIVGITRNNNVWLMEDF